MLSRTRREVPISLLNCHIWHVFCSVFQGSGLQVGEKLSQVEQTSGDVLLGEAALLFDVEDAEMNVSV